MSVFLRTVRLVLGFVVFKGLTRVRGSNYPLDTKFLTLSLDRARAAESNMTGIFVVVPFALAQGIDEVICVGKDLHSKFFVPF